MLWNAQEKKSNSILCNGLFKYSVSVSVSIETQVLVLYSFYKKWYLCIPRFKFIKEKRAIIKSTNFYSHGQDTQVNCWSQAALIVVNVWRWAAGCSCRKRAGGQGSTHTHFTALSQCRHSFIWDWVPTRTDIEKPWVSTAELSHDGLFYNDVWYFPAGYTDSGKWTLFRRTQVPPLL